MKPRSCFLSLLLAGSLGLSGCKSPGPLPPRASGAKAPHVSAATAPPAPVLPATEDPPINRAEAYAHFAAGVSLELNDQAAAALDEFYQSALDDPGNEPLVIELSRRLLADKQTGKALKLLGRATKFSGASGNAHAWLARAYLASGRTNEALQASEIAIKKSPGSLAGYQNIAEIYYQNGHGAEVGKVLDNAARQKNVDAIFLVNLAELYARFVRAEPAHAEAATSRARELLSRAALLQPANPVILQKMADFFALFGDTKKSAAIYLQLLADPELQSRQDLEGRRDFLHERLVNIYLQAQDKTNAIEQLEAIVRDNPTKYPQAYYHLGALANDLKNYDRAAEYYGKAILLNPEFEQAYYDLAGMQINVDKAREALRTLMGARQKFPQSFVVEFLTALAYSRLKEYPESLKHFTSAEVFAAATDPKRLTHLFYYQLGATHERNHDLVEAEKYFRKCLELSPEFAAALNYLGYMWAENGVHLAEARSMIEKAVKLEPKNAAFLDSFGWVLYKLHQPAEALAYVLKSVELATEPDATLLDHMGDIYQALEQPEKACDAWQKSLQIEPNDDIRKKLSNVSRSAL